MPTSLNMNRIMYTLSKSKVIAHLQCPKRLWLQVHRPDLMEPIDTPQIQNGYAVGNLAQSVLSVGQKQIIDIEKLGFERAFTLSKDLLQIPEKTICEAGFQADFTHSEHGFRAIAFADILRPHDAIQNAWHMIEVKSSTSVKPYQQNDIAVQYVLSQKMGVAVAQISIAHIDSSWEYQGDAQYQGIFTLSDQTDWVRAHEKDALNWIHSAHETLLSQEEPKNHTGGHCADPFECPFIAYCTHQEIPNPHPQPATWLPRPSKAIKQWISENPELGIGQVPAEMLNAQQLLVQKATCNNSVFHDHSACNEALSKAVFPYYFIDFETSNDVIPKFAGARPYQQIPFQWSAHVLTLDKKQNKGYQLLHHEFLDLTGKDPRRAFIEQLIDTCGETGSIFVYNAAFENRILRELKTIAPDLTEQIDGLIDRVIDLLPITRQHYYHPKQKGSWSIKAVLPTVSDFDYGQLEGVQHGGDAIAAYQEATNPETTIERREQLRAQLSKYCEMDTLGMFWVWERLTSPSKLMKGST